MRLLDIFGWRPKDGAVYVEHESVKQQVVGQKVYKIIEVVRRKVEVVIDGKAYSGLFSVNEMEGTCRIQLRTDRLHRFIVPLSAIRFSRKITKESAKAYYYNVEYTYPVITALYRAEVIDSSMLRDTAYNFEGLSNEEIARTLFRDGVIAAGEPAFIYERPPMMPFDPSRIEGMLLGIAIGDSLGNTSESMASDERQRKHGLITDYLPNRHAGMRRVGLPSDDTQLSFDTLKVILENNRLDVRKLARAFASHRIFGIGGTVKQFLRNYKIRREPWYYAGVVGSVGNGALMRIAPVLVTQFINPYEKIYVDAVLATALTHNSSLAVGSSVAFVRMLNGFLYTRDPPGSLNFIDEFAETVEAFTGGAKFELSHLSGRISDVLKGALREGLSKGMSIKEFSERFGSSGHLLETDISMLYILANYMANPQEAIIQAVNYTYDNDTIASIVGAAVGALYGRRAFRESWIRGLLGRIREYDDGTVFDLINETIERIRGAGLFVV